MGNGECEVVDVSKKGRHRKKQLYNSILQQMEFYFSDSNLSKDRFLSRLVSEDPYVDIKVFLSFNKIRKLNCSPVDICKALKKSDLLELSEDNQKIRRKTVVKVKQNVDECTIYVENIKADATHESLSQVFAEFGNVVYVSIPKYKQTRANKGFAFVEFETEKDTQNVLSYFESINCKMPSDTNPEELVSIKTFDENPDVKQDTDEDIKTEVDKEGSNKRKFSDEHEIKSSKKIKSEDNTNLQFDKADIDSRGTKKRKLNQEHENVLDRKLASDADVNSSSKILESEATEDLDIESSGLNNLGTDGVEVKKEHETAEPEDSETKKKKKSKKDKKKNLIRELGMKVLSKKDWKKMRNRYLDLQRKKMKEFKKYLHNQKFSQKSHELGKKSKDEVQEPEVQPMDEAPPKIEYVPGVIVKLKLHEPCADLKKLKNEIKSIAPEVQFVDIPLTRVTDDIFVRFANSESAKDFCTQDFSGEKTLLDGEEEQLYWEKIKNDRERKFSRSTKKQRGRDKLLKKAEKERAKHMRFDEGE